MPICDIEIWNLNLFGYLIIDEYIKGGLAYSNIVLRKFIIECLLLKTLNENNKFCGLFQPTIENKFIFLSLSFFTPHFLLYFVRNNDQNNINKCEKFQSNICMYNEKKIRLKFNFL